MDLSDRKRSKLTIYRTYNMKFYELYLKTGKIALFLKTEWI